VSASAAHATSALLALLAAAQSHSPPPTRPAVPRASPKSVEASPKSADGGAGAGEEYSGAVVAALACFAGVDGVWTGPASPLPASVRPLVLVAEDAAAFRLEAEVGAAALRVLGLATRASDEVPALIGKEFLSGNFLAMKFTARMLDYHLKRSSCLVNFIARMHPQLRMLGLATRASDEVPPVHCLGITVQASGSRVEGSGIRT